MAIYTKVKHTDYLALIARVEALEAENTKLKSENADLKAKNEALKAANTDTTKKTATKDVAKTKKEA